MWLPFSRNRRRAAGVTSRRNSLDDRTRRLRLEPLERRELLSAVPVLESGAAQEPTDFGAAACYASDQNTSYDAPSLHSTGVATRTVTFQVHDGDVPGNSLSRNIAVVAVNDAPVLDDLETAPLVITENDYPVRFASTITTHDEDSANFVSATIQITGNYQPGEDVLSYIPFDLLTGSWDPTTGTIRFTGEASISAYMIVMQTLTYQNLSDHPSTLTRTVTFTANDGTDDSIPIERDIIVTPVNDTPTLNAIADPAAIREGAGQQTVSLGGISAGGGESQGLAITATSSHPDLIPNPTVRYTSPGTTASLAYQPAAGQTGTAMITVTVRDAGLDGVLGNGDDGSFQQTFAVTVQSAPRLNTAYLAADPLAPDMTVLYVYGTLGRDRIVLKPGAYSGDVSVSINGRSRGSFHPTSRIVVHALAGNDQIRVNRGVATAAWLYGDEGNDTLWGGGGPSLLEGGAGNDHLWAGNGRSLMLGGTGKDHLWGGSGGAILLGGTTDYEADDEALLALLSRWNSGDNYASRVAQLTAPLGGQNDSYRFSVSTVHDDGADDHVHGGSRRDLYLGSPGDSVFGKHRGEIRISLPR